MAPKRKGQPTKPEPRKYHSLTPELHRILVNELNGLRFEEDAAAIAGIGSVTLRNWLKRGARDIETGQDSPEAQLCLAVRQAEAETKTKLLNSVAGLSTKAGDWRGMMALLEKRWPIQFMESKRVTFQVEQNLDRILDAAEKILPRAQFEHLARVLAEEDGATEAAPLTAGEEEPEG
jgi:hypothetical protein